MSLACQPSGPISFHQSMNFGCHASSARCRRRSPARLTLFGIKSLEIVAMSLLSDGGPGELFRLPRDLMSLRSLGLGSLRKLGPRPVEGRPLGTAVQGQRAVLAGRV